MLCPSNTARSTGNYSEKIGIQPGLRKQPAQLEGDNRKDEAQGVVREKLQDSEGEGTFCGENQGEEESEACRTCTMSHSEGVIWVPEEKLPFLEYIWKSVMCFSKNKRSSGSHRVEFNIRERGAQTSNTRAAAFRYEPNRFKPPFAHQVAAFLGQN